MPMVLSGLQGRLMSMINATHQDAKLEPLPPGDDENVTETEDREIKSMKQR